MWNDFRGSYTFAEGKSGLCHAVNDCVSQIVILGYFS